jgi:hypothetical protein
MDNGASAHGELVAPAVDPGINAGAAGAHHESPQNSTPHGPAQGLSPKHSIVLKQLLAGATVTKAAMAGGADRSTVHRWLREDAVFQAAYNAARRDLSREVEARLPHLAEMALETVQAAVEKGDVRAALAVLKGLGALPGAAPHVGAEDPGELAEQKHIRDQQAASLRNLRRLLAV